MARVTKAVVEYELVDGTKQRDVLWVRRLRYSNAMRLMGILTHGVASHEETDAESGETVRKLDAESAAQNVLANTAQYQIELIAARVCDADGKKLFTPDEVDSWSEPDVDGYVDGEGNFLDEATECKYNELAQNGSLKIKAYAKALDLKPKTAREVAGNSSATPVASSSTS